MTEEKKKKLSAKHKALARNLIKTQGNQTKAYMMTYPKANEVSARKNASRVLAMKPEIKHYMTEVLDRKGMSIDSLAGKLKKLLIAKRSIVMSTGEVIKVEDNSARMNALTTAFKLHGQLQNQTTINKDQRSINIDLSNRSPEDVSALMQKMSELNSALALDEGMQDGEIIDADFSKTDDSSSLD